MQLMNTSHEVNSPSSPDHLPLATLISETTNPTVSVTQLKELATFNELGTLAAASHALHLTQPTVTRGIQHLESTLGVPLFHHRPNRLVLTRAGEIYAQYARCILELYADSLATVRGYVSAHDGAAHLHIGATLPGPLMLLDRIQALPHSRAHSHTHASADTSVDASVDTSPHISIDHQLCQPNQVIPRLRHYTDALIFTSEEIFTSSAVSDNDAIESAFIGSEHLSVCVNKFSDLASRHSVTFADLHDQQFLVVTDIGEWKKIIEDNIPGARFMYQQDLSSLLILQNSSVFPTFISNLSQDEHSQRDDRVTIPIDDPANRVDVYGTYLISQKKKVMPLIRDMTRLWPSEISTPD